MSPEIKYAYLKSHPLFANATEQSIQQASDLMKVKTIYRNESFGYGDASFSKIFLLIQGKIKIAEINNDDSSELIKDILTAPDIFGDLSMEGNTVIDEYAEALTANTVVCIFTIGDLKQIMHHNPAIAIAYANLVNKKLRKLESKHSDLVFRDAKSRLIRFIKNWAMTDGNRVGDKIILNNYLTHTDIANVIATSRQSVNVLFNELRDEGLLFYNRKHIELNDQFIWN
ncbi:Crp/Fnr family transcriptional regulator [Lacibacter sediminis]|uniref:Crp/Fnr family transcriptional regulator n=1 Tax=Lacibacter sediminis TaxID=2760713 RepID=A0A7G5XDC1_9BACT|nr:Crp/Fnr family transcriptional regulator [Lacibacter sediminis]QNA43474.1 Crp/Fnr family transcriptional regulator [Lacibacter sediminis]